MHFASIIHISHLFLTIVMQLPKSNAFLKVCFIDVDQQSVLCHWVQEMPVYTQLSFSLWHRTPENLCLADSSSDSATNQTRGHFLALTPAVGVGFCRTSRNTISGNTARLYQYQSFSPPGMITGLDDSLDLREMPHVIDMVEEYLRQRNPPGLGAHGAK